MEPKNDDKKFVKKGKMSLTKLNENVYNYRDYDKKYLSERMKKAAKMAELAAKSMKETKSLN